MTGAVATAPTLQHTYADALEGAYVAWRPAGAPVPRVLRLNDSLASELGLDAAWFHSDEALAVFAGNAVPDEATPIAQAYAGHQFGSYSPLLGDGRALLLGEVVDAKGRRRDIALKGSGATPFSRGGDGKAALGPVLREYLMGEAMHALGIPTTRALAAVATGEQVRRETLLPGAVLTRVAASHLRVGTFEFAARRSPALLAALADYAIERHYPELAQLPAPQRHLEFLRSLAQAQANLIAAWLGVGFIHGVMNTDNMTISGETIDYGPCAFMETYDPATAFSSIDHGRRYAYGNQPGIALWNLTRFAETLVPLVADSEPAESTSPEAAQQTTQSAAASLGAVLDEFSEMISSAWTAVFRAKLGLPQRDSLGDAPTDAEAGALAQKYLDLLAAHRVDFTLGWRSLIAAAENDESALRELFGPGNTPPDESAGDQPRVLLDSWLAQWRDALSRNGSADLAAMRRANPLYIPRNHLVEESLDAAARDDLEPFDRLLSVLADPFTERDDPEFARYAEPAPAEVTAQYRTFCGT